MTLTIRQAITIIVLGCLLSLNSVALPQVVRHSLHHDHHTSSTHTSPICSWVCTASQMEDSWTILPPQIFYTLGSIDTPVLNTISTYVPLAIKARAPPFFIPS